MVCWAIDEDDVLEIDYRLLTDLKVKNLKGKTDPSNQVCQSFGMHASQWDEDGMARSYSLAYEGW